MTPACIKTLYQLPTRTHVSGNNSLGVFQQGDYFVKSDFDQFLATYAPYVPQKTYPIPALIDGAVFSVSADDPLYGGFNNKDITIVLVRFLFTAEP